MKQDKGAGAPGGVITVTNLQRRVPVSLPWLRRFAVVALNVTRAHPADDRPGLGAIEEVSVVIVSDRRIAQLHEDFMGIPGPTDVLTFDHGDIAISAETARTFAAEYGQPVDHEIALYLLHGLLHLQGFDDRTPTEHRRMHQLQTRLMKRCLARLETD